MTRTAAGIAPRKSFSESQPAAWTAITTATG
jgi:hypothetical protein